MAGLVIGTDKTATIPVLEKEASPVINSLNVTPSTSTQVITASGGVDGYSPVNVAAVNASIDANITAGNIKKDVTILGVTGSYEGSAPAHYIEYGVDANNKLTAPSSIINLSGVEDIPIERGFYYSYYNDTNISGAVDFSSLNVISGNYACSFMFSGCTGLTGADLHSLTTISGTYACQYMFRACTGLTYISLPYLMTISGQNACSYMFQNCTHLTSINLNNLTTISGTYAARSMFQNCDYLTTASFPSLNYIPASRCLAEMFYNCSSLTDVYFPALNPTSFGSYTSQFNKMLSGCSNVTVHFPLSLQNTLGGWSDVVAGFGGTNTTVLYDLPDAE